MGDTLARSLLAGTVRDGQVVTIDVDTEEPSDAGTGRVTGLRVA